VSDHVEGVWGNREVPPDVPLDTRGDLGGAWVEPYTQEGGSWGKHGFPHATEPKAREVVT
jgi:hypothetical protein